MPPTRSPAQSCSAEDDALQLEFATSLAGGVNAGTLLDAQRAFARAAARHHRWRRAVALPAARDPAWRPIDPARDAFWLRGRAA